MTILKPGNLYQSKAFYEMFISNGFNDYDNIVLRVNDLVMFIDREITESEYERPFNVFLYKGNIVYDLVSWEPTFIKTFNEIKQQQ